MIIEALEVIGGCNCPRISDPPSPLHPAQRTRSTLVHNRAVQRVQVRLVHGGLGQCGSVGLLRAARLLQRPRQLLCGGGRVRANMVGRQMRGRKT